MRGGELVVRSSFTGGADVAMLLDIIVDMNKSGPSWRTQAKGDVAAAVVEVSDDEVSSNEGDEDPEVVRLTVLFIYILGAVQPLMAIEFTLGGALRGAGDTHYPFITTLIGLVCVRGTVAACAVWWGLDVGWVLGALIFDYAV